jgi:dynein heavy chain
VSLEKAAREKPFSWISDQGWEDIMKLTSTEEWEHFNSLADDVQKN